jgi:hypothetical protein
MGNRGANPGRGSGQQPRSLLYNRKKKRKKEEEPLIDLFIPDISETIFGCCCAEVHANGGHSLLLPIQIHANCLTVWIHFSGMETTTMMIRGW